MSKKRIKTEWNDDDNLTLTCKICGEPIIKSIKLGMYCENECGIEEDREAKKKIMKLFPFLKNKKHDRF